MPIPTHATRSITIEAIVSSRGRYAAAIDRAFLLPKWDMVNGRHACSEPEPNQDDRRQRFMTRPAGPVARCASIDGAGVSCRGRTPIALQEHQMTQRPSPTDPAASPEASEDQPVLDAFTDVPQAGSKPPVKGEVDTDDMFVQGGE